MKYKLWLGLFSFVNTLYFAIFEHWLLPRGSVSQCFPSNLWDGAKWGERGGQERERREGRGLCCGPGHLQPSLHTLQEVQTLGLPGVLCYVRTQALGPSHSSHTFSWKFGECQPGTPQGITNSLFSFLIKVYFSPDTAAAQYGKFGKVLSLWNSHTI